MTKPIIAIDGPAASGKSTVAKLVAKKLGLYYIDTGAMYRALALKAEKAHVNTGDVDRLTRLAKNLNLKLDYRKRSGKLRVFLDNKDVTREIRKPYISKNVSLIAKIKKVRDCMVILQRKMAKGKHAILEGRDITTVVFPNAYKKFYLDAGPDERIKRRFLELKESDIKIRRGDVRRDIAKRDKIDSTREYAPLRRAPDAIYINTTNMTINQVVSLLVRAVNKK